MQIVHNAVLVQDIKQSGINKIMSSIETLFSLRLEIY